MNRSRSLILCLAVVAVVFISFRSGEPEYAAGYRTGVDRLAGSQKLLLQQIKSADLSSANDIQELKAAIAHARTDMKAMDFWFRYLEPLAHKSINGPLPVEWETEVFEKFEKPYRRQGAGFTLAYLYLEEQNIHKDSLLRLISSSLSALDVFSADSVTSELNTYHHFYLCNRLFLLNLAAIYTTGFECPDPAAVIPELSMMLKSVTGIYASFNNGFSATALSPQYMALYSDMVTFVDKQPSDYTEFDHFTFIKDYVSPLYAINQKLIAQYRVISRSMVDFSLNKRATSIFDKNLYNGQDRKGIFLRVTDSAVLAEIESVGKLLFYDPVLSGNNMRSCASCHKPTQYFTDTAATTPLHFNRQEHLARNTPSLINAVYNHLLMLDGKHFTLQNQTRDVISNPKEMACDEKEIVEKVLSCRQYRQVFQGLLKFTPQESEVTLEHITSAITYYYGKFSTCSAPFDDAMNGNAYLDPAARNGFNLFMGKAQCGTCHFVPQFNGVKPPYIGSEFEVLGVPADTLYTRLSPDDGRYVVNPAHETRGAFRTGTIRNAAHTAPYMHNGVFRTLSEVIDFYDAGGGAGRGFSISNQTLAADSLRLTAKEKSDLISFITSLDETIIFETPPVGLPVSKIKKLNNRKPGGEY